MAERAHILLVDGEKIEGDELRYLLESEGYEVDQALCGTEALSKVKREQFDLVLAEILLPDMDGLELIRYLAMHAGRAVSRDELLANVWRISPHGLPTRTVDMHIARLRDKLKAAPDQQPVILTVRGKGYMFASSMAESS